MTQIDTLRAVFARKGYRLFQRGDYNLNLIGVRSHQRDANTFNDTLLVAYYLDGHPHLHRFQATTDPGLHWRHHLANPKGTAIMVPGQYPRLWRLGQYQGDTALLQQQPVTVYRDSNRDATLDIAADAGTPTESGVFGIHCHRARRHGRSQQVDRWSAGCQVLADSDDFALLIALCRQATRRYGNHFTYTLLSEDELSAHSSLTAPTEQEDTGGAKGQA